MKPVKSSEEANKIRMNGATVNFGERGGKLCIKNTVHFKNLILKIFLEVLSFSKQWNSEVLIHEIFFAFRGTQYINKNSPFF